MYVSPLGGEELSQKLGPCVLTPTRAEVPKIWLSSPVYCEI